MKFTLSVLALVASTNAWTMQFDCPRGSGFEGSYSGSKNKGCTSIPTCTKGDHMVWGNTKKSNCVLRLYAAAPCAAEQEIGHSKENWDHKFGQPVFAWGVTNC
ncbi:hypothetical protein FVEG_12922 [Fusarium verticillioides 7600]|uniref:Uncharacterized protein n=2 Tax=Fusarium TaxID=5506 RepID=W7MUD9_GIBM7|nr:hypothetical protein FVEG_12922 [Fusarium verticillioides 7600]XP_044674437.1 hypothetical protein J7337_013683 [Fusarium musae]KAF5974864.1 hypothetical protein FCOIX_8055 [Fusarium coicis]RBQ84780.1 hypothetical protein FVER53263_12922 [Fusarium verticillioides]EWG54811.1 hypothetical protein FVEG_12922 [Fusarium verticillioides 7600]KAG9495437.1 hypothetical protein J7337_013683 [Fusarium musae]RBR07136.1 hypothetical protein FVER53590_12922 [Fusarium verticillioides]